MCSDLRGLGRGLLLCVAAASALGCAAAPEVRRGADVVSRPWPEIEDEARGSTLTWAMWMGDPFINDYVAGFIAPELRRRHGIELRTVSAQGQDIVNLLMTEIEAGKRNSEIDLVWINGETFYQLRQLDALYGPFTDKLPGGRYVDFDNPFIRFDFQQEIAGYECPWGNVQFSLIYDSARVASPPRDRQELATWVRRNPGRFTIDTTFTGLTFLKSLLIDFAGGPGSLDGPFDAAAYAAASAELWRYINEIKPHFWRGGETFPARLSQMHQLFATGELYFTMSNNDGEVDNKVLQGLFPDTARAYVLTSGTIRNSHYLGIPRRARNVAAALVAVDFLISPEAQYEKLKPSVWGDGTILDVARLPAPWPERFASVPERRHAPPRDEIRPFALTEPASEYMLRLDRDFRTHVIER